MLFESLYLPAPIALLFEYFGLCAKHELVDLPFTAVAGDGEIGIVLLRVNTAKNVRQKRSNEAVSVDLLFDALDEREWG